METSQPNANPNQTQHPPTPDSPDIIDTLLPCYGVNLVGGSSGVGKTTFLLQLLSALQTNQEFLGHCTRPVEYIYVSCDRDATAIRRTCERVGVSVPQHRVFPMLSSASLSLDQLAGYVVKHRIKNKHDPSVHYLVLIEGMVRYMRSGNMNDYRATADFLADLTHISTTNNCTFIGTVHAAKARERDMVFNPRERVLGSVAWSAYSKTIIFIEPLDPKDPTNPGRKIWVMPRESQAEEFDFSFSDDGRLHLTADESVTFLFDADYAALQKGEVITTKLVREWAEKKSVTERTAYRWLAGMWQQGRLEKLGRGAYKKIS